MIEIIKTAIQRGASDLHIKAGDVLRARIHGDLVPMTKQRVTPEQTRDIALKLIPRAGDRERIDELRDYDCSWGLRGLGRFRVNILRQRGSLMVVMRVIPVEIPSLESLRLPPILEKIATTERGLVLVTGVTGSGKSTTLASMIGHVNQTQRKHVVTLENPIEFLHRDNQSSITQREVGTDTESFATGLRAALREDPDVILIGEMRDTVTIDTALKAAETGHLVLSTLHTEDAVRTIARMVAVFPPQEQDMVRIRLSEGLLAVISQRLLPRKDVEGRIVACEVMLATSAVREVMREADRAHELHELIAEGREQYGSQTFDQHLMELVAQDLVEFDVAMAYATNPSDFELKVKTLA